MLCTRSLLLSTSFWCHTVSAVVPSGLHKGLLDQFNLQGISVWTIYLIPGWRPSSIFWSGLILCFRRLSSFLFRANVDRSLYSLTQPQGMEYTQVMVIFCSLSRLTWKRILRKVKLLPNIVLMFYGSDSFPIRFNARKTNRGVKFMFENLSGLTAAIFLQLKWSKKKFAKKKRRKWH